MACRSACRGSLPASPRPARRSIGCRARPGRPRRRSRISASSAGSAARRRHRSKPFWYRVGVRALPEVDEAGKPLVLWTRRGHHPRPRAAGQRLPRAAARHRLSRPRAGRLLLRRCRRAGCSISTRPSPTGSATTSPSSSPAPSGSTDIVRGDGASLLMRGRGDGEIRTEIIDIDLVRRNGTTLPGAPAAPRRAARRWRTGRDPHAGARPPQRRRRARKRCAPSEVRFSRFFNDTPFAIATLDKRRPDHPHQCAVQPHLRLVGRRQEPRDAADGRAASPKRSRDGFAEAIAAAHGRPLRDRAGRRAC